MLPESPHTNVEVRSSEPTCATPNYTADHINHSGKSEIIKQSTFRVEYLLAKIVCFAFAFEAGIYNIPYCRINNTQKYKVIYYMLSRDGRRRIYSARAKQYDERNPLVF